MDVYRFVSWCLVVMSAVMLIFPINILLVALAYKVKLAGKEIDMDAGEFWWRCSFAALGLAGLSLVFVGIDYALIASAEMPAGPVQLVLFLVYVPAAIGYLYWIMGMDDLMNATSVFMIYIVLPGLAILVFGRIAHLWQKLPPWMLPST